MQAPNSPDYARSMGSLDRLDSLDEYDFMLSSPPDSPAQARGQVQNAPGHNSAFEAYGYYPGNAESTIASQGNIKQSTAYNISVDRSNATGRKDSFGFGRMMSSTQRDIDEMLKLDDKDLNLAEMFLRNNHRRSLNQNYQAMGTLNGHDKELHRTRSNSLCSSSFMGDNDRITKKTSGTTNNNQNRKNPPSRKNSKDDNGDDICIDFDLDVEPTPLSEIKAKSEERKRMHDEAVMQRNGQSTQAERSENSSGLTSQKLDQHDYELQRQYRHQHHGSNYYPYGRSYQLPIPTMPPSSPPGTTSPQMTDAVATAAALASVQHGREQQGRRTPSHSPSPRPPSQPSWQNSDGSQNAHIRGSNGRPQSHSPNTSGQPYSHHNAHSHPIRGHHSGHHSPYAKAQNLATPLAVGSLPPGYPPGQKIVGPYTTAQQGGGNARRRTTTPTNNSSSNKSSDNTQKIATTSSYIPRRGDQLTREAAAAHTTRKGVLAEAAKQRREHIGLQQTSTYHHPAPSKFPSYGYRPPITTVPAAAPAATAIPALIAKKPSQDRISPPVSSTSVTLASQQRGAAAAAANQPPADTAYERKKQRAKDARVKLNESIERLHVAMGVAGTESKKRTEQLRHFMKQAGREHENQTDHQAFQLMDSCVKTAESAKKWDRPNFVGSAATLIECLNSQCEILMRELMEYQVSKGPILRNSQSSSQNQDKGPSDNIGKEANASNCKKPSHRNGEVSGGSVDNRGDANSEKRHSDNDQASSSKRRKLEDKKEESACSNVETNPIQCP